MGRRIRIYTEPVVVRRMEHNRAAVEPHRAAVGPRREPVVAAHTEHSVHMRCGKGGKKDGKQPKYTKKQTKM